MIKKGVQSCYPGNISEEKKTGKHEIIIESGKFNQGIEMLPVQIPRSV